MKIYFHGFMSDDDLWPYLTLLQIYFTLYWNKIDFFLQLYEEHDPLQSHQFYFPKLAKVLSTAVGVYGIVSNIIIFDKMAVSQGWKMKIQPKFNRTFSWICRTCANFFWLFSVIRNLLSTARKVCTHSWATRLWPPIFSGK